MSGEGHAGDPVDRLTFWRNWYTAARQYPDRLRLAWYDAVLDFAFEGIEPESSHGKNVAAAVRFAAVQTVRATIDISRKRKQFGAKGGSVKAKAKQKRSKTKADRNQEQEQVQVQEQEQEHIANSYTATARKPPTEKQFLSAAGLAGVPEEFARRFFADLVAAGWADANGRHVGNWRRYLRTAYDAEQKKIRAARVSAGWSPERGGSVDNVPDAR